MTIGNYKASKYVCSTNSEAHLDVFLSPKRATIDITTVSGLAELPQVDNAGTTTYVASVKACNRLGCSAETFLVNGSNTCSSPESYRKISSDGREMLGVPD